MERLIFSTRLSELMKNAKVTQQDLVSYIGTTRQAISKYADGSVQPNIEKLYKIAKFFDVSADYLLGLESDSAKATIAEYLINAGYGNVEQAVKEFSEKFCDLLWIKCGIYKTYSKRLAQEVGKSMTEKNFAKLFTNS